MKKVIISLGVLFLFIQSNGFAQEPSKNKTNSTETKKDVSKEMKSNPETKKLEEDKTIPVKKAESNQDKEYMKAKSAYEKTGSSPK